MLPRLHSGAGPTYQWETELNMGEYKESLKLGE